MNLGLRKFTLLSIVLSSLLRCMQVDAQQMPLYSQYMMNGFVFNPAVAGSDGFTTVALSTRDHMMGFENSPKTFVVSAQARLMRTNFQVRKRSLSKKHIGSKRSGKVGIGGYIFNDRNGYIDRTGAEFAYAYHIYSRYNQVSLGVALSTFQFKINDSKFVFGGQEPIMNSAYTNKMLVPDATAGIYFLRSDAFGGFSVANIFQTRIKVGSETYDYRMYRHYFLMGGKRFLKEETFSFEPSCMLKATEKFLFQADLQMRCYYNKDYYLGVSYRTGAAVGILIGVKWERLHFGYAFDYSLTPLQQYTIGAHELNLAYKFGDNTRRYRWLIRY